MSYISVDVHINEILQGMSSNQIQELVDDLYDSGYVPKQVQQELDNDFNRACEKLKGKSWRLTREEEEFIINLSKKY